MEVILLTDNIIKIKRTIKIKCPNCKKNAIEHYIPFCSKKCSDIDLMKWFTNHYIADDKDSKNIYVSPIRYNNPAGLPDAVVVTAGFDPLRDEGIAYAKHLRDAGVKVIEREHEGTIHAFANFTIEQFT